MGVIMQAFYWDCPKLENKESGWWNFVKTKVQGLSKTGFTALWLPPACKAANLGGPSMGYDPYDFYDLGNIDQKGAVKTWFGSRHELESLIVEAHHFNLQVYADMVLNHTSGADAQEVNPLDNKSRWTKYTPASGRFKRDWTCYHPSVFERYDDQSFDGMPDLCHRNPGVYEELMEYTRWLIEDIGFDGFRYDFVRGYGTWLITALLERLYQKNGVFFSPFGVGEYWDENASITEWLRKTNSFTDNPVAAFDFALRGRLKALCDSYGFDLTALAQSGTLITDGLGVNAVTFVENHDVARSDAVVADKMLAYAFILTHEGYPCVFWQDYYNYGLAREGQPTGIATLVNLHGNYAGGRTDVLHCDRDLYIMQRRGSDAQPGLVFALNNSGNWNGRQAQTQWAKRKFRPAAWYGTEEAPMGKATDDNGRTDFWAPPRGYVVYVPEM